MKNNSIHQWFGQKIYIVNEENADKDSLEFMGGNKKGILILIANEEAGFLSEKEEQLLLKGTGKKSLLEAINLSLEDIAIFNLAKSPVKSFYRLKNKFAFTRMLAFGILPPAIRLNMEIRKNAVFHFSGCRLLFSDRLELIAGNDNLKKELWLALQQMFEVKK